MKTILHLNKMLLLVIMMVAVIQPNGSFAAANALSLKYMELKTVRLNDNKVLADWTTIEDQSTRYYILEKSIDGINYIQVHQQNAQVPGESNSQVDYQGIDLQLNHGTSYYRVQRVNFNGEVTYSNAMAFKYTGLNGNGFADLEVYPNPYVERFSLKINCPQEMQVQIIVVGCKGKTRYESTEHCQKGENVFNIDMSDDFVEGTHFIQVINTKTGEKLFAKAIGNGK